MRAVRGTSGIASALSVRSGVGLQQRFFSGAIAPVPAGRVDVQYKGRQSVSGIRATVFGGYGFVGRYVINRLGRIGSQVIVPYRGHGMNTRHLKLMGDLGQIVMVPMDMTDVDSIRRSVEHSNVVINLIGAGHETKNYSYDDVHVKCVHRIAKICAEAGGVKRFIHVSAAGADADSRSKFLQSKAEGEEAVKAFFPEATIIRPCDIFGTEDKFLNRTADLMRFFPWTPLINAEQQLQPIYVQDVAQAIVNAMVDSKCPGKTYTLGGPEVIDKSQLYDFVKHQICRPETSIMPMPEFAGRLYAMAAEQFLPVSWRLLSQDDMIRCDSDNVVPKNVLGCADLNIKPVTLQKEGSTVLIRHRGARDAAHNQFELPKGYGKFSDF